jgi:hypothetical protein
MLHPLGNCRNTPEAISKISEAKELKGEKNDERI